VPALQADASSFLEDAAHYPGGTAAGVLRPRSIDDVSACLRDARRVLAVGAQSSLTGGATPFGDLVANFNGRTFDVFVEGAAAPALRSLPGDVDGKPGAIDVVAPDPPNDPKLLLEATVRVDWVGSFGPRHLVRTIRISRPGANP